MSIEDNRTDGVFCQCETIHKIIKKQDGWKVWYVCADCRKRIKWSERYYHYYDGEMCLEPDKMGLERLLSD